MPIAEDSAGGSPVPIPTNLTTNLTGEATGSGTLDYTTGDIDIAVTVVDNGHNHILSNITDVQVNNAISGQILVYNGTVWANATNTSGITAIVQDLTPQLGGNLDLNGKNINGNGNINLADNYKLTLGTGNDLEISHDGVSSYIRDVGAGDLQIFASDDVYIRGQGSNTYMARFNESGAVTLYHNNVVRLITTDSGITVTDEVEAVEFIGPLRGPTKFKGQAGEALSAGDPVYISGISGNTTVVSKADANDASKMPAFGIIDASVSANASCQVLTFGEMHNLDTSAFSEGDELYVSNTGTLTTAIPSGESSQIQKIAKVTRSHASAGGIFIMGAGRSNAVPNLDNGDIFIGDGTNHATTTSLNTAVNALTLTNYLPLSGGAMTGNITTSGTFDGRDVSVDGAKLDGIATGADVTLNEISAGTNVTISAGGVISSTASGGLAHVVDDTTPQLGGNLDLNSNDITGTGNLNFTGSVTLSGTVDGRDVAADGTKLDGIEASADVTDTANVTAAGALMDSEVTNLAQVKAFDSSDYATAAQGTTADAALPKAGGTMTGDILFNDGVKAKYGTSSDLQIYHDGSNSIIDDSGTGNLYIRSNDVLIDKYTGERMIRAIADGAVTLYYDNAEKLATTSNGIQVTNATNMSMDASASGQIKVQGSGYGFGIALDADAANLYTNSPTRDLVFGVNETEVARVKPAGLDVTGKGTYTGAGSFEALELKTTDANRVYVTGNSTTSGDMWRLGTSTSNANLNIDALQSNGEILLRTGGTTERMRINSGGIDVTGGIDVANGTTYTTTGDFLAKVQQNSNATGKNGLSVMNAWASNTSTIFEAAMGWDGSAAGYYPVFTIDGLGKTTWKNNFGNIRASIDDSGLDVNGSIDVVGASNTRQWSVGTAGARMGVYALDNSTMYMRVESGTSTNLQFGTYDNIPIYTITNNSVKTTLLANGNFGIGTTAPKARTQITSGGYATPSLGSVPANASLYVSPSDTAYGLVVGMDNVAPRTWLQSQHTNGASVAYPLTLQEAGGNVGIGTSAPKTKTQISASGTLNAPSLGSSSTNAPLYLTNSDTSYGLVVGNSSADGHVWLQAQRTDGTATAYNMTLNEAGGNVGIGTSTPSAKLSVAGDLTVSSTIEVGSLTPNQDGAIEVGVIALGTPAISSTTSSTGLMNHIIFDNPNGAVGKINTLNSSTSYLTSSDYRLKTDVQEMTGSIDRVKALRPVNFEWIVDGTRVDGFLAHEAQEVVPEAVDGEKDAMRDQQYVESEATGDIYTPAVEATYETIQVELTPAVEATYDEDGNELTPAVDATYEEQQQELTPAIDEVVHSTDVVEPDKLEEGQLWRETTEKVMATRQVPDYQGIDQSKIVPLLTSALQDAIAKIEALETRLEALES